MTANSLKDWQSCSKVKTIDVLRPYKAISWRDKSSKAPLSHGGRINSGDPLFIIDRLLAATVLEHGLILVTRNVRDVERSGMRLLNPFTTR